MTIIPFKLPSDNTLLRPIRFEGPQGLSEGAREYLRSARSLNTRMAYKGDLEHFYTWGGELPSSPEQVASYLAYFAGKLKYATLARRLVAISVAHKALGVESPTKTELVHRVMSGIARTHGRKQRKASPLTIEILLQIFAKEDLSLKEIRDRALLLVGFAGGFRRSELVGIRVKDLEFQEEGVLIRLPKSKTDQEGKGRVVPIPHVGNHLCAHCALQEWLAANRHQCPRHLLHEAPGSRGAPVFRSLVHGRPGKGGLSGEGVGVIIKDRVRRIGLNPADYSGHSLRAGFVTSAARAGFPLWQIKEITGHKSLAVLEGYIRDQSPMVNALKVSGETE